MECYQLVQKEIKKFENQNYKRIYSESRTDNKETFFTLYGGFFFLGIMFLMVTALIIYFKQISEGYADGYRIQRP